MLDENIVYLATSTEKGKPNIVPIGLLPAIGDEELPIVDMLFTDLFNDMDPSAIHQEYLSEFQELDYDLSENGVFVYPQSRMVS